MNDRHQDKHEDKREDKLVADARQLQTEISPERDLWPAIATTIARPERSRWTPMLARAAAVVLLVGASSGVTYLAVNDEQPLPKVVTADLMFEQASFGTQYTLGPAFQDARNNLASKLDRELLRLSPEARADVERNLRVIRGAIAEISDALDKEPDNVQLQELLLNIYHEELRVMRDVGGLTQSVMSRNDI